jgi:anti-anti-sigma factor
MSPFFDHAKKGSFTNYAENAQYAACIQEPNGLVIKVVTPSVGQHEAPIISLEVMEALKKTASNCNWVVIDLSAVSVVSSMGLAMCLDIRKQAKKQGMKTILFGMNAHLRGLFQMMRVERLYKVMHSKDDLKALIKG